MRVNIYSLCNLCQVVTVTPYESKDLIFYLCVTPQVVTVNPYEAVVSIIWAIKANPILGCSIENSRDIYKTYYTGQHEI